MKYKRYYLNQEIILNSNVVIEGEEFIHLSSVMRSRVGDVVTLFNGDGYNYNGVITAINKKNAVIQIQEKQENQTEPKVKVTLFQALVKGDKLSTIVQKNTELGTHEIVLFESRFSDVKVGSKNLEKQQRVVVAACKQCGSSTLLKVDKEIKFEELLKQIKSYDKVLFAYENEEQNNISSLIQKLQNYQNIAVIVGAEGGFSEEEVQKLIDSGAISISLGKRILRAETAGIVLPALVIMNNL